MKYGKAGNPDIMDDVDIIIGASTDIISGEGKSLQPAVLIHMFTLLILNKLTLHLKVV